MSERNYILSEAQRVCLSAKGDSERGDAGLYPRQVHLSGRQMPVVNQSGRGSCVANAIAALVEYYEDCRYGRLSVQYLAERTREMQLKWVGENLESLKAGGRADGRFAAAFPETVRQIALLVQHNGDASAAVLAVVNAFAEKLRSRIMSDDACRLEHGFAALREHGICRYKLCPYSEVASPDGGMGFPPETVSDARKHRIVKGELQTFPLPNNVDVVKGILSGEFNHRPMPVVAGLDIFGESDDDAFRLPETKRDETGRSAVVPPYRGIHEILITGYADDKSVPGGGYFEFRNSWGASWGDNGYGRLSYAYFASFCREAGTILQEEDDYDGAPPTRLDGLKLVILGGIVALCVGALIQLVITMFF